MIRTRYRTQGLLMLTLSILCLSIVAPRPARANFADEHRIQPPTLEAPGRGSIAGRLSEFSLSANEITRGSFSLPAPFEFPDARGAPLFDFTPSYSPESGLSEWGMGFAQQLAIRRDSIEGEVDYAQDEFVSPWGRLLAGDDGYFYPAGFQSRLRFEKSASGWLAIDGEGTEYTFALAVTRSAGVYAWYLTQVTSLFGEEMVFDYEVNASGRPFLTEVHYGGRGSEDGYAIQIYYEPLAETLSSFVSGEELVLDRRVLDLRVYAENGGVDVLRWFYEFTYAEQPESPVFYLDSLTRVWPSRETDPAVRFDYDRTLDHLKTAVLQPIPSLDSYLASGGSLIPSQGTLIDLDGDGLMDFEHAYAQAEIRQPLGGGSWTIEATPTVDDPDPACRRAPGQLGPRDLARIHPLDPEPRVIAGLYRGSIDNTTEIRLCDRRGSLITAFELEGDWTLDAMTRFVDLNADQKPELVRVGRGRVEIAENLSPEPGVYIFGPARSQILTPSLELDAAWIQDLTGDGVADLVARTAVGSLGSWRGIGNLAFETERTQTPLMTTRGDRAFLVDRRIGFVDANQDGLADVILSDSGGGSLFLNTLGEFHQQSVPVLSRAGAEVAAPLTGDFAGSGYAQLSFIIPQLEGVRKAFNLALNRPSTGLLTSVDDGMGTVVRFDYGYSAPQPGVRRRIRVLEGVTVGWGSSLPSELADFETRYGFARAMTHSVNQELLGFEVVRATSGPILTETTFRMGDLIPPVPTAEAVDDTRSRDLARIISTRYETRSFHGVDWLRAKSEDITWAKPSTGEEITTSTSTSAFAREFCPRTVETTSASGTLVETTTFASPTLLVDELHCLSERQELIGSHPDRALDFKHVIETPRNDHGQVVSLSSRDGSDVLELQRLTYDSNHRLARLSTPAEGETSFSYGSQRGFLASMVTPLGIRTNATLDPSRDTMTVLSEERGGGHKYNQWFRFDTRERLMASWDSVYGGRTEDPLIAYSYRYADAEFPGMVTETRAMDRENGIRATAVSLFYPNGETLARYQHTPDGWTSEAISVVDRTSLTTESGYTEPLPATRAPATLSYADVLADATLLDSSTATAFDVTIEQSETVQAEVRRNLETSLELQRGELVSSVVENGALMLRTSSSADGTRLWSENALGDRTTYTHDVLGRLRRVELADGVQEQRWTIDGHGRIATIERTNVGRIVQKYDATTGLLVSRSYRSAAGEERSTRIRYDEYGRVTERLHTLSATGETARYTFLYDGELPAGVVPDTASVGQVGYLTGVTGPGFSRYWVYGKDGRNLESGTRLDDGLEIVETDFTYFEDGEWRSYTRKASTPQGASNLAKTRELDATGRLSSLRAGRVSAFNLVYDRLGRLQTVSMPSVGANYTRTFDPVTRRGNGYIASDGVNDAFSSWEYNARGLIASEETTAGGVDSRRSFIYDPRRFLLEASNEADGTSEAWSYDAIGLLASIRDHHGSRTLTRSATEITAGERSYALDGLGRVVESGSATLSYGPNGQLASTVTSAGAKASYLYSEEDQRLATVVDGMLTAAFIDDAVYTAETGLLEPVEFAGRLVALLDESGRLQPVAADPRGTLASDPTSDEALTLSAYGSRTNYTPIAAAFDFVRSSRDSTSGTVRFGVRDYDPYLGQFLSPDPLFLMEPELSIASPVEANLYGYAGGDPINFTDPSGTFACGGLCIIGAGALIGAGIEAYRQLADTFFGSGKVRNNGEILAGLAVGAASGAVGGGAGFGVAKALGSTAVSAVASAAAGGAAGGTTARALSGESVSASSVATDAAVGAASYGVLRGAGAAARPLTGRVAQRAAAARLPQDVAVNPRPPKLLDRNRSIGRASHNRALQNDIDNLPDGARDIRVNQEQVNARGRHVGRNRPDLQYTLKGRRFNVEYEGLANPRGAAHEARILANDPNARVKVKLVP